MLYVEKAACPPKVAEAIEEKKHSELWQRIIDPARTDISEIEKQQSVQTLRAHFEELDKKALRPALLQEQHYLCAYCMAPIEDDGQRTSIEHWSPLSAKKENAIDYNNFLAVCDGGRNTAKVRGQKKVLCCDASKKEKKVTIDPRNRDMMNGVRYTSDGLIEYQKGTSFDAETLQIDIDTILNLNGKVENHRGGRIDTATRLIQQRRNVFRSTERICLDMQDSGDLNEAWLSKQIEECLTAEKREPFAGVSVYVYSLYRALLTKRQQE